jgi:hypothetical protein
MILLAVDPGLNACGAALFDAGILARVAYVENDAAGMSLAARAARGAYLVTQWAGGVGEIALEWPRVYAAKIRAGASRGDPNDLLVLAGVDAALAALADAVVHDYAPSDWKGQMKKEPCAARARSRLSESELRAVAMCGCRPSKMHNVWDAIGIGLHHLGRLAPRRVIAP